MVPHRVALREKSRRLSWLARLLNQRLARRRILYHPGWWTRTIASSSYELGHGARGGVIDSHTLLGDTPTGYHRLLIVRIDQRPLWRHNREASGFTSSARHR